MTDHLTRASFSSPLGIITVGEDSRRRKPADGGGLSVTFDSGGGKYSQLATLTGDRTAISCPLVELIEFTDEAKVPLGYDKTIRRVLLYTAAVEDV